MLEPVRQYAAERLEQRRDADAVRARHFDALPGARRAHAPRAVAARAGRARVRGRPRRARQLPRGAGLGRRRRRRRAACAWPARSTRTGGPRTPRRRPGPGIERALRRPRRRPPTRPGRGSAWPPGSWPLSPQAGRARRHAALELYRGVGDDGGIAEALLRLSNVHSMNAEQETAYGLAEEALEHARAAGDDALAGYAQTHMAISTADLERGLPLLDAGVAAMQPGRRDQPHRGLALHGRLRPAAPRRLRRGRPAARRRPARPRTPAAAPS